MGGDVLCARLESHEVVVGEVGHLATYGNANLGGDERAAEAAGHQVSVQHAGAPFAEARLAPVRNHERWRERRKPECDGLPPPLAAAVP